MVAVVSVLSDFWERAKETPDERRLRQRREAKGGKPPGKSTQRKGIVPERCEIELSGGRTIRFGESDEERSERRARERLLFGRAEL
jgi:hypothetical protein